MSNAEDLAREIAKEFIGNLHGPNPDATRKELAEAIASALRSHGAAIREDCAKIAEEACTCDEGQYFKCRCAKQVAAAIRKGAGVV